MRSYSGRVPEEVEVSCILNQRLDSSLLQYYIWKEILPVSDTASFLGVQDFFAGSQIELPNAGPCVSSADPETEAYVSHLGGIDSLLPLQETEFFLADSDWWNQYKGQLLVKMVAEALLQIASRRDLAQTRKETWECLPRSFGAF